MKKFSVQMTICLMFFSLIIQAEENGSEDNSTVESIKSKSRVSQSTEKDAYEEELKSIIKTGGSRGYYTKKEMDLILQKPNPSIFCRHKVDPINIWSDPQKTKENQIGKGGFGTVYKGVYNYIDKKGKSMQKEVAAKYIPYNTQTMLSTLKEINFMRRVRISKHHMRFYQCYYERLEDRLNDPKKKQEDTLILMMALMNGDANGLIKNADKRKEFFAQVKLVDFLIEMAKGIRDLHWMGIIHRDIKPENYFLDKNNLPIVGDLGLCEFIDESGLKGIAGTPYFLAPEVIKREVYNLEVDIYSLGVAFYCLIVGLQPNYFVNFDLGQKSGTPVSQVNYKYLTKSIFLGLIQKMTDQDPKNRPIAKDVVEELERIKSGKPLTYSKLEITSESNDNIVRTLKRWIV